MNTEVIFAIDRSARRIDKDGRLHVAVTNISKATVNPYYGREIPDSEALGLEPDMIYQVFRDPEELAKAAPTFNNVPLLDEHVIVSADDPKKHNIVGSTGTDARFDGEYLQNSLVVWDAEAIRRIESGEQKEISCAYRYDAVKRSGTHKGLTFTLAMSNMHGNHVALVKEGRAGPDVVVADAKLGDAKMKFSAVKGKVAAKFATDKAFKADRSRLFIALDEMEEEMDGEDEECTEAEVEEKAKDKAKDAKAKDAARDKKARDKAAKDAEEKDDDKKAEDESEEDDDKKEDKAEDKKAMDAAIAAAVAKALKGSDARVTQAADAAAKATIARIDALNAARAQVLPHVGDVMGMDSAEAVYRFAFDKLDVDVSDVDPSAFPAMMRLLPKPGATPIAQDAAAAATGEDWFEKNFGVRATANA